MFVGMGANGASGGYNLENSLRLRSSANAYLSRTPSSTTNRKTWTWSGWVKRGTFGTRQAFFSADPTTGYNNNNHLQFGWQTDNTFQFGLSTAYVLITNAVYRDPSSWYHVVLAIDTTQATASNRAKLYINGSQVTSFSTNNISSLISQNMDLGVNLNSSNHLLGMLIAPSTSPLDGYLTEVNFVDGQALTPSDFGETNATTGVWQPIKYTGTYGTNGFYLPMNQTVETYSAEYLVVAGGGGASSGGGGAGGLLTGTITSILPGDVYIATVGSGGAGVAYASTSNQNGSNSVLSGTGLTTQTALGGGYGGSTDSANYNGNSGGSGGGGAGDGRTASGGAGTSGQGYAGGIGGGLGAPYSGGGGGGAGAVGANRASASVPGGGGIGVSNDITGSATYYAGGGGGSAHLTGSTGSSGGLGGGGNGASTGAGGNGVANTGGGGGGSVSTNNGGNGGSGVVILRMPTAKYTGTVTGSPTVTTTGSDTVIKFTANGSYTA